LCFIFHLLLSSLYLLFLFMLVPFCCFCHFYVCCELANIMAILSVLMHNWESLVEVTARIAGQRQGTWVAFKVVVLFGLQLGTEFAAEHLLPLLCPLLIVQQLNLQQFAKYMHFVKEVIRFAFVFSSPHSSDNVVLPGAFGQFCCVCSLDWRTIEHG
jgi:hypothetical protein